MTTSGGASERLERTTILALVAMGVAVFIVANDFTALAVALPAIEKQFNTDVGTVQWVINAYALTFGVLIVVGGRLADIFGRKRIFIIGAGVFAVFSVLGGAAQSSGWLIACRALMGIGGAMMWPAILGMTFAALPERRMGEAALIPRDVIGNRNFSAACLTVLLMSAVFSSALLYLPQFMQKILGYSPLESGVGLVPMMGTFALTSFAAGPLYSKLGPKLIVSLGSGAIAVGILLLSLVSESADYSGLVVGMLVLGVGIGLFYSSITTAGVTALDASRAGLAGGIVYMFQIAGGSIGLGLNTTIFTSSSKGNLNAHLASVGATVSHVQANLARASTRRWRWPRCWGPRCSSAAPSTCTPREPRDRAAHTTARSAESGRSAGPSGAPGGWALGRAGSTAPTVTATNASTRSPPQRTRGHGLFEHDRAREDRHDVRQERCQAGDGQGRARLVAELDERRAERVAENQREDEGDPHTALRGELRGDVAGREAQAAGDRVRHGRTEQAPPDQDHEHGQRGRRAQPQEHRDGRSAAAFAAAAGQRDGQREQPEHRGQDPHHRAPAEAPSAHAEGQVGEDADAAGRDALHERERGEREGRDVEGEPAALHREAEQPAAIAQQQADRVQRAAQREGRQGGRRGRARAGRRGS